VRGNWKKRLGVCGGLTLLVLTVIPALAAHAQTTTGEIDITVKVIPGTDPAPPPAADFSFSLDGGTTTTHFNPNGTNQVTGLDTSVPLSVTPVDDHSDFTSKVTDAPPDIQCTNVTPVDPTVGTPPFCLVTYTFIEPVTTTTTTTTTLPPSTTAPPAGQTIIHGSSTDQNACTSHLDPNLQPDGKTSITLTMATDASPQPHRGDPITLAGTKFTISVPAGLLQQGVNVDLIHNGDQVPSTVTVVVKGLNTVEQTHSYVIHQTAVISTVKVPVSKTFPKGVKALPLVATVNLPDTHWTPVSATKDVAFFETSMKIVSHLKLGTGLAVTATFICTPTKGLAFVAVGATGVANITTPTVPPAPGLPGGGAGGGTTGSLAGGAQQLPRTGSSPWPLFVVGAVCLDLGMLAVAAAKRRRRPLHH
jgi:hypothetical protein